MPEFSGYVCYETEFQGNTGNRYVLEITDAAEGVELFVNGISAGIQLVPIFRYEITQMIQDGTNRLRIEVATTLERENAKNVNPMFKHAIGPPVSASGIVGKVLLWEKTIMEGKDAAK